MCATKATARCRPSKLTKDLTRNESLPTPTEATLLLCHMHYCLQRKRGNIAVEDAKPREIHVFRLMPSWVNNSQLDISGSDALMVDEHDSQHSLRRANPPTTPLA